MFSSLFGHALVKRGLVLSSVLTIGFMIPQSAYRSCGLDFWNFSELRADLATQEVRAEDLTRESIEVKHASQIRRELLDRLEAGETTVREAFPVLLELNQMDSVRMERIHEQFAGESDEESTINQLIANLETSHQRKDISTQRKRELMSQIAPLVASILRSPQV